MKRFSYLPTLTFFGMLAETQVFFKPHWALLIIVYIDTLQQVHVVAYKAKGTTRFLWNTEVTFDLLWTGYCEQKDQSVP